MVDLFLKLFAQNFQSNLRLFSVGGIDYVNVYYIFCASRLPAGGLLTEICLWLKLAQCICLNKNAMFFLCVWSLLNNLTFKEWFSIKYFDINFFILVIFKLLEEMWEPVFLDVRD